MMRCQFTLEEYRHYLELALAHGYRFVAFTSGYGGVQFPHADVVMHARVFDDFEEEWLAVSARGEALSGSAG